MTETQRKIDEAVAELLGFIWSRRRFVIGEWERAANREEYANSFCTDPAGAEHVWRWLEKNVDGLLANNLPGFWTVVAICDQGGNKSGNAPTRHEAACRAFLAANGKDVPE